MTQHYPVENKISHKYNLNCLIVTFKKFFFFKKWRDFPGGPVVKMSLSNTGDAGLISEQGAKIPHALQAPPPQKNPQNCNKFNQDFLNGPHQKRKKKRSTSGLYIITLLI